jgi:hypothetical protein
VTSFEHDEDINNTVHKFKSIYVTIKDSGGWIKKGNTDQILQILLIPILLYGNGAWVLRKREQSRKYSAEVTF